MRFDICGDIHGHAEKLVELLGVLGYQSSGGVYRHTEKDRKVLFLGDFIDRGPSIRATLKIVKAMVDAGSALAIMGNHEYNAICFHTLKNDTEGKWMRSRNDAHIHQHIETLYQFKNHRDELGDYLDWFWTLPLYYEIEGFRAIHASWDPQSLEVLSSCLTPGNLLTRDLLDLATNPGSPEYDAIQNTLKGVEIYLPESAVFIDKDGVTRREMRVQWWMPAEGKKYREIVFPSRDDFADDPVSRELAETIPGYQGEKPVFFGHYWLEELKPSILAPNVACLDYSVARNGFLAAYTWQGESELTNKNFVSIRHAK